MRQDEEYSSRQNSLSQGSRRKSGYGCLPLILLLVVGVALCVFVVFQTLTQRYANLNAGMKVARVCAKSTAAALPHIYVQLALYGNDGKETSTQSYQVQGNQVYLQGDIITYLPVLNSPLQPFYKLTRLEGQYNDLKLSNVTDPPLFFSMVVTTTFIRKCMHYRRLHQSWQQITTPLFR